MIKLRYFCLFLFLILSINECYSQNKYSIGLFDQYGYVFPTNEFIRGGTTKKVINQINSFSLRFSSQTNGSKPWHQLYNYPSYGLGFSYFNFNEPKRMGEAYTLYCFYTANLFKFGKFILKNDFALGIGYFPKHWGLENLQNLAIMTPFNAYIHEGLKMEYLFSKRYKLSLGIALVHFSNGAIKKPNKGVNSMVTQLGFTYNLFDKFAFHQQPIPEFKDNFNILSSFYFGFDNVYLKLHKEEDLTKKFIYQYYPVAELSETFLYTFNSKHALGISFNVCYQDNMDADYFYRNDQLIIRKAMFFNRFNLSSAISYEYSINRISIILEPGIYIVRNLRENSVVNYNLPLLFQNVGIRYAFPNNYFLSIRLRAYDFHIAHYLQFGFGYRIHI